MKPKTMPARRLERNPPLQMCISQQEDCLPSSALKGVWSLRQPARLFGGCSARKHCKSGKHVRYKASWHGYTLGFTRLACAWHITHV